MVSIAILVIILSPLPFVFCKLSLTGKVGVVPLSQNLVYRYCHGIWEIETAQLIAHRYPYTALWIVVEKLLGKSLVLPSENKVWIVGVFRFTVDVKSLCGEVEEVTALVFLEEVREAVVIGDVQLVPVVQTCTFQVLVADLEAQRTYKVQSCSRNGAGSGDISRILRYLGFNQDDI